VTRERVQEGRTREEKERYRRLLEERNRLQSQLNRSSQLAFMGQLAAGIAHEINNPLGIILGFVQDMLDEISDDHPLFESIKIVEHETTRCVDVVRDLLDFVRSRAPERKHADIVQLLEDSISLLVPQVKKSKIKINKAYDKTSPRIEIDPHLIQQVFLNVMINAVQAMPHGGELSLGIGLLRRQQPKKEQHWVEVIVSDTGCGIPEKDLERVFEPFFTTKGGKGTGLGLSVCERIMDDHHGKIELESHVDKGTTCCLYFPVRG
jgi:signal transduction histidine kinase